MGPIKRNLAEILPFIQIILLLIILLILLLSATRANASEDNNMFTTSSMTANIANNAAWGALQEFRKRGYSVDDASQQQTGARK